MSPTLQKPARKIRLNKFLAQTGIASRRKADALIEEGRVFVNGRAIKELGTQIDPLRDQVRVGNKILRPETRGVVIAFYKPPQVLTTMFDPEGRPTVADYFQKSKERLFPVGRLDWASEGLLIMTNDGDLAQQIQHPKHDVPKTYLVKVPGRPTPAQIERLKKGVTITRGKASADKVEKLPNRGTDKYSWIKIVISEGRNRQVRRMLEKVGLDVVKLQRVAIGGLRIGSLKRGEFKVLTPVLIDRIFKRFPDADED
jgi:23S rRNA pseudouridine2605 synthase